MESSDKKYVGWQFDPREALLHAIQYPLPTNYSIHLLFKKKKNNYVSFDINFVQICVTFRSQKFQA